MNPYEQKQLLSVLSPKLRVDDYLILESNAKSSSKKQLDEIVLSSQLQEFIEAQKF